MSCFKDISEIFQESSGKLACGKLSETKRSALIMITWF